jgi:hypothetical protein
MHARCSTQTAQQLVHQHAGELCTAAAARPTHPHAHCARPQVVQAPHTHTNTDTQPAPKHAHTASIHSLHTQPAHTHTHTHTHNTQRTHCARHIAGLSLAETLANACSGAKNAKPNVNTVQPLLACAATAGRWGGAQCAAAGCGMMLGCRRTRRRRRAPPPPPPPPPPRAPPPPPPPPRRAGRSLTSPWRAPWCLAAARWRAPPRLQLRRRASSSRGVTGCRMARRMRRLTRHDTLLPPQQPLPHTPAAAHVLRTTHTPV